MSRRIMGSFLTLLLMQMCWVLQPSIRSVCWITALLMHACGHAITDKLIAACTIQACMLQETFCDELKLSSFALYRKPFWHVRVSQSLD